MLDFDVDTRIRDDPVIQELYGTPWYQEKRREIRVECASFRIKVFAQILGISYPGDGRSEDERTSLAHPPSINILTLPQQVLLFQYYNTRGIIYHELLSHDHHSPIELLQTLGIELAAVTFFDRLSQIRNLWHSQVSPSWSYMIANHLFSSWRIPCLYDNLQDLGKIYDMLRMNPTMILHPNLQPLLRYLTIHGVITAENFSMRGST